MHHIFLPADEAPAIGKVLQALCHFVSVETILFHEIGVCFCI